MRYLLYLVIGLLPVACATESIKPFEDAKQTEHLSGEENRLWHAAGEFDHSLAAGGNLYPDDKLQHYVQQVMDRLYPEYKGSILVRVVDSPSLNAFALPNGSIYINTGMLARLDNEAQMATVLAHEGVHFVNKHGWLQRRNIESNNIVSMGITIVTGVPGLGQLMAASSIYGFSRDLEREADVDGLKRLQDADYDISQAAITFQHLLAEVEALNIEEPYFFSSHPDLVERIDSFTELASHVPGRRGYVGQTSYQKMVSALRLEMLEDYLAIGKYQSVLLMLTNSNDFNRYPPEAKFYLGEAYRLRGEDGDSTRAAQAYQYAIVHAPHFVKSYRALGIHYMKAKQIQDADKLFSKYLQLAPDAPDRAYIENYRASLNTLKEN